MRAALLDGQVPKLGLGLALCARPNSLRASRRSAALLATPGPPPAARRADTAGRCSARPAPARWNTAPNSFGITRASRHDATVAHHCRSTASSSGPSSKLHNECPAARGASAISESKAERVDRTSIRAIGSPEPDGATSMEHTATADTHRDEPARRRRQDRDQRRSPASADAGALTGPEDRRRVHYPLRSTRVAPTGVGARSIRASSSHVPTASALSPASSIRRCSDATRAS
jgi:hypothetical protein